MQYQRFPFRYLFQWVYAMFIEFTCITSSVKRRPTEHSVVGRPSSRCSARLSMRACRHARGRHLPQHRLCFFPLLHGHGSLRPVPGYFSLCMLGVVVPEAGRDMLGNISRCRLIIGTKTESQKSANSVAFIPGAGRIWARLSFCSFSGSNARFQDN